MLCLLEPEPDAFTILGVEAVQLVSHDESFLTVLDTHFVSMSVTKPSMRAIVHSPTFRGCLIGCHELNKSILPIWGIGDSTLISQLFLRKIG